MWSVVLEDILFGDLQCPDALPCGVRNVLLFLKREEMSATLSVASSLLPRSVFFGPGTFNISSSFSCSAPLDLAWLDGDPGDWSTGFDYHF